MLDCHEKKITTTQRKAGKEKWMEAAQPHHIWTVHRTYESEFDRKQFAALPQGF